jgi:hypothetical protein
MGRHYAGKLAGFALFATMGVGCATAPPPVAVQPVAVPPPAIAARAALQLDCPTSQLVVELAPAQSANVRGCGHHAVYAMVNGSWFLAKDDLPRIAEPPVVAIEPVLITPEPVVSAPRHKHHAHKPHHQGRRPRR